MAAGLVATVVLSLMMVMKAALGWLPELDLPRLLGAMFDVSEGIGWVIHFIIGTVFWGGLFGWMSWARAKDHVFHGMAFGLAVWLLMMVLLMPMAGKGFFALEVGIVAALMTAMLHAVFGAVLGGVYGLLAHRNEGLYATQAH